MQKGKSQYLDIVLDYKWLYVNNVNKVLYSRNHGLLQYITNTFAGAAKWFKLNGNEACLQHHQSPINIEVSKAKHDGSLGAFTMDGYDKKQGSLYLENNGHSGELAVTFLFLRNCCFKASIVGSRLNKYVMNVVVVSKHRSLGPV